MSLFSTNPIECVGIVHDEFLANRIAKYFDEDRLRQAGGKVEFTQERAVVRMISYWNSVKGWIILIERRDLDCVGQPWPTR